MVIMQKKKKYLNGLKHRLMFSYLVSVYSFIVKYDLALIKALS